MSAFPRFCSFLPASTGYPSAGCVCGGVRGICVSGWGISGGKEREGRRKKKEEAIIRHLGPAPRGSKPGVYK